MYIVQTLFDKTTDRLYPIASITCNTESNEIKIYMLYAKHSNQKLTEVDDKIKEIKTILLGNDVILNDYKSHILFFGMKTGGLSQYNIYETLQNDANIRKSSSLEDIKVALKEMLSSTIKTGLRRTWQKLAAEATETYVVLQKRGLLSFGTLMHPEYEISTYSGRSKSLGFNAQGVGDDGDLRHIDSRYNYYVCADWISADLRVLSLLSQDNEMLNAFSISDPYTYAADKLNIPKDEVKIELLRDINSLSFSSRLREVYPTLYNWSIESLNQLNNRGYLSTILDRKFNLIDNNHKSVFNAVAQGSVAHAMHNSLSRLNAVIGQYILTEVHDSIIFCCDEKSIKTVINAVHNIMVNPFRSILDDNPTFPIRVSVGTEWRKWKTIKEMRHGIS